MLKTSSSLAFRSLLKTAANRAGIDREPARLSGLTKAGLAFHAAVRAIESPVFLVVPSDADVEEVASDARFFYAALAGATDAATGEAVRGLPSLEVDPYRGLLPHLEIASERAGTLYALARGSARLVVASARALGPRLSQPSALVAVGLALQPGDEVAPHELGERLGLAGFIREDPVDEHGEFVVRGGVVDIFPAGEARPIRLEFVGDVIESIRQYDAATQRSLAHVDRVSIPPQRELLPDPAGRDELALDRTATIRDYVRQAGASVLVSELADVVARGAEQEAQWEKSAADLEARGRSGLPFDALAWGWPDVTGWIQSGRQATELAVDEVGHDLRHVSCLPASQYRGRVSDWVEEIRKARELHDTVVFVALTSGRAERTIELLAEYEIRARAVSEDDDLARAAVLVVTGQLSKGFHLPGAGLRVFAETDLFEEERRTHERRRSASAAFISDFRDLKVGDLVVHVDSGIGRFVGLKRLAVGVDRAPQEFMELRYAGEDKLFVPLERLDLVQKYTGGASPTLDRLGGATWEKAKTRVKKAMRDMAEELLKLYAARKAVPGHAFSLDSHWQEEFADAFEYEPTPDQRTAIADITRDMETATPMDRLLCGDVGYGKTEVAMRAAFKAVIDGKQAAFLAPTTILAFQHLRTLTERFAGFPVSVEMISRFRSKQEQKAIATKLAAGQIDIIVGTHRLLSKDIVFRDLGLLVVDEEQRFGVAHKEKIKQLRKKVDVLTMTATPIPRTLNMSLVGIRDMSVIETPPRDRLSIQTQVVKFDADVITRAIRTELERGGQVYFVHNRVESIYSMGNLIARLVPNARVAIGHGQMSEDELEKVMIDFVAHKFDMLLATTIVENGLDIPNANTIIINRADRYGLAQLYQLRGRVGRSDRRAYAYLLIPAEQTLSPIARRRLAAIREFSDLGSGFRIAALDLEIRGAGNLLGGQQSGHIEAVGFDMYVKLLEETIRELKGEDLEDDRRAVVNLRLDLRIGDEYVPDMNQRLSVYRRMASARTTEEVDALVEELADRYGPTPANIRNLGEFARIRLLADRVGIEAIDREGSVVVLKFRSDARLDPAWLFKLVASRADLTLLPPAILRLDLGTEQDDPGEDSSWWTTRATAGGVKPGFRRELILAEAAPDPTVPGGLFERLGRLLAQLSAAMVSG